DLGKMFAGISSDTKVLSLVPGRFYVLDENRFEQGNVKADEKEEIIQDLIQRLEKMKDPETGDLIIRKVFRKEDIFTGSDLDRAPDVVVDPHDGYDLKAAPIGRLMVNTPINGMHTQYDSSLFIEGMKAPDRKPMIYDVTATILDIMGIDIPDHFDGTSLLS
ncbi:MAG: nucleotide pyrophosphatase, partial [Thermoplasmata archaeon]|nr:nucleotide pyrophosphatase [Thermoplasmata archaeon]